MVLLDTNRIGLTNVKKILILFIIKVLGERLVVRILTLDLKKALLLKGNRA